MDTALIVAGSCLVIPALLLIRLGGRRPVAAPVLAGTPLALLSLGLSLSAGISAFMEGFRRLAAEGKGGVAPVAALSLSMTRHLTTGAATVLSMLLLVCIVAVLHALSWTPPGRERVPRPASAARWAALIALTAIPAAGLGVTAYLAERLVRLSMLAVVPAPSSEAAAEIGRMTLAQFSAHLANLAISSRAGSMAFTALLVIAGIGVIAVVAPVERNKGIRVYAWFFLGMAGLLMLWHLDQVLALQAWIENLQDAA